MWTFAMKESDLRENRLFRAYPRGVAVLIVKANGLTYSLSSNCPHMGCSMGGAILENDTVQCPCHDWKFDVRTGRFTEAKEIGLATYPVKIENNVILINL